MVLTTFFTQMVKCAALLHSSDKNNNLGVSDAGVIWQLKTCKTFVETTYISGKQTVHLIFNVTFNACMAPSGPKT